MPVNASTTWNPQDVSAGLALTQGNLRVQGSTASNDDGLVRATDGQAAGKFYFEVLTTALNGPDAGVGIATAVATGPGLGANGASGAIAYSTYGGGRIYIDGQDTGAAIGVYNLTSLVRVAVDVDARLIWFACADDSGGWNEFGGTTADPAFGTGGLSFASVPGPVFPMLVTTGGFDSGATANFGASAFQGTPPAGFFSADDLPPGPPGAPETAEPGRAGADRSVSPSVPPSARGVADYAAALLALLPQGRVWSREPDSVQARTAAAMVPAWVRNDARALALLADAFPAHPLELLPEWEASLGLPDPCAGPQPTVELRQIAVRSRLTAGGGQSIPYFVAVAAALGYAITIEEFLPFRFGQRFGRPLADAAWAHAWRVRVAGSDIRPFRFGVSKMGEPFATWGGRVLECTLRAMAPAHTVLVFAYDARPSPAALDGFVLDRDALA